MVMFVGVMKWRRADPSDCGVNTAIPSLPA